MINKFAKSLIIILQMPGRAWSFYKQTDLQKQPQEVFCEKDVLRNLAKFTGKHLCQSLFFNKVAGSGRLLLDLNLLKMKKVVSWSNNVMVTKIFLLTFWLDF